MLYYQTCTPLSGPREGGGPAQDLGRATAVITDLAGNEIFVFGWNEAERQGRERASWLSGESKIQ